MPSESYQALMRGLAYSSKNCKFFFLLIWWGGNSNPLGHV
jgi:hypothetical protein